MDFTVAPFRWLGYAMAAGEALVYTNTSTSLRDVTRGITCIFVVGHAVSEFINGKLTGGLDALIFELLASAIIPTFVVKNLCDLNMRLLRKVRLNYDFKCYFTTFIGIVAIALMSEPLDNLINTLMDMTIRKLF